MAREFHNLAGWVRDVRKAIESGHQLAYETAELLLELDDLIDTVDGAQPDMEDGSGGTDHVVRSGADRAAPNDRQLGLPGTGSPAGTAELEARLRGHDGPQEGSRNRGYVAGATGLSDAELAQELRRRGIATGNVPRGTGGLRVKHA